MSDTRPGLVSVVIPYYNGDAYIRETIDAVRAQTYPEWEIVLIDDGSSRPEASEYLLVLVSQLADARIRYSSRPNQGLSRTRNEAIAKASGEFIAILDQDDLWRPDKLARQVACFQDSPECGMVYTNTAIFHEVSANSVDYAKIVKPVSGKIFDELLFENRIVCSSAMIRKVVLDEVGGFDPKYRQAEEYDLFLRIALKYPIAYVDAPLTTYRVHAANTTVQQKYLAQTESREIFCQFENKPGVNPAVYQRALLRLDYIDVKYFVKDRRWGDAICGLSKLLMTHPGFLASQLGATLLHLLKGYRPAFGATRSE